MPWPTIDQMVASLEADHVAAQRRADAAHKRARAILDVARSEGRGISPAEFTDLDRLVGERDRARRLTEDLAPRLAEARAAAVQEADDQARANDVRPSGAPRPMFAGAGSRTASFSVGRNERTYRPDTDPQGSRFVLDVARQFLFNDPRAADRLNRHQREEEVERGQSFQQRASTSGDLVGLVVPQYLTDMFAPAARAMRPFAEVCNHHDLPGEGMTVNIPLLSTPTQVGVQTPENTAGPSTNPANTLLTENVQTFTGNSTISRQAIERGTGVAELIMQDLFNALATDLDSTLINQATTGLSALGTTVTYTSAAPSVTELWPYLFQAGSQVAKAVLQMAAVSHLVMGIERWNWLTSALSSQWPFAGSAVQGADVPARQAAVSVTDEYGPAVRGRLANGWLICVDGNVPTNLGSGTDQDQIYVVASRECHLWEDPNAPVMIRAEQPAAASLGVLLVVYEYAAYSFRRYPGAVATIDGTGLVVPAGF